MTNPGTLVAAIVAKLRLISDLVTELGGDATVIDSYDYRYPKQTSIADAIYQQDQPSVLVAWRGTAQGNVGPSQLWQHQFSIYLRPGVVTDADPVTDGVYKLFDLIVNGTATGDSVKMLNAEIHASCFPMDAVPRLEISTLMVDTTGKTVDTFEVQFSLTEIRDS